MKVGNWELKTVDCLGDPMVGSSVVWRAACLACELAPMKVGLSVSSSVVNLAERMAAN